MAESHARNAIAWYRTPIPAATLKELNARSDVQGLLQSGGYFLLLVATGAATLWSAFAGYWYLTPFLLYLHGTIGAFNINAVHELCHNTVFKSKWLNAFFLRLFGFFGWNDWVWFNASHANHHRYTLHPPRDGEVVLPIIGLSRKSFWQSVFGHPLTPYRQYKGHIKRAFGALEGDWTQSLFPEDKPEARARLRRWNASVVIGHLLILIAAIVGLVLTRHWAWLLVPLVVSHSSTYAHWLQWLVNNTQHVGLTDKVPDFRLCCRSMKLPWIVSFLYWRMEYHTEHHMYAAVPCYNLPKLNRLIKHDLPEPKGLVGTWKEIAMILERQQTEPEFQYLHPFPASAHPPVLGDSQAEAAACQGPTDPDADCADAEPAIMPDAQLA